MFSTLSQKTPCCTPFVVSGFHQAWSIKRKVSRWKEQALASGPGWGLQIYCSPLGAPLPSYSAFQFSAFLSNADLYCPSVVRTQVYSAKEPGSQWPFSSCRRPLLVPSSPLSAVPWTFVLHGQAASICGHLAQPRGFFIWTESFVIFPEDGGSSLIPPSLLPQVLNNVFSSSQ